MKGFEAAISAPQAGWPDEIVVFGAASEPFSPKNVHCSIAKSIERLRQWWLPRATKAFTCVEYVVHPGLPV